MLSEKQAREFRRDNQKERQFDIEPLRNLPRPMYKYMKKVGFKAIAWKGDVYVDLDYWNRKNERSRLRLLEHECVHLDQQGTKKVKRFFWKTRYLMSRKFRIDCEIEAFTMSIYGRLCFNMGANEEKYVGYLKNYGAKRRHLRKARKAFAVAVAKHQKGQNPLEKRINAWLQKNQ